MSVGREPLKSVVDAEQAQVVRQHLAEILQSPVFRGSERCRQFLEFVVEYALDGRSEELKERVIGAHVFHRPAGYETATDAIVRVKAGEVRKRLAQYYMDTAAPPPVRIDLPSGSYVPRFHWPEESTGLDVPSHPPAPWHRRRRMVWVFALAAAAVIGAAWFGFPASTPAPEPDRFWQPVIASPGAPLLCIGFADSYMISNRLKREVEHLVARPGQRISLQEGDIVRLSEFRISNGTFLTVIKIYGMLERAGRRVQLRTSGELKLDELSGRPVILIGAYTNPWTLRKSSELRFAFQGTPDSSFGLKSIRDRLHPETEWSVPGKGFPWEPQTVDYALVSRVFDAERETVMVIVAGINTFGTLAAGEFLTNPRCWAGIARRLPAGWERKNLQFVLKTSVVNDTPNPPEVVAWHLW